MQIILDKDEYMTLRPNKLSLQFVDKIRAILAATKTSEEIAADVRNAIKELDVGLQKQRNDDYLLW